MKLSSLSFDPEPLLNIIQAYQQFPRMYEIRLLHSQALESPFSTCNSCNTQQNFDKYNPAKPLSCKRPCLGLWQDDVKYSRLSVMVQSSSLVAAKLFSWTLGGTPSLDLWVLLSPEPEHPLGLS